MNSLKCIETVIYSYRYGANSIYKFYINSHVGGFELFTCYGDINKQGSIGIKQNLCHCVIIQWHIFTHMLMALLSISLIQAIYKIFYR